jgi:hypothetical protein
MVTPIEQEFERRALERMVRLFNGLGDMSGDMAARDDFGEFVRTIYIDLSKAIGFPKEEPIPACPEFEPADKLPGAPVPPPKAEKQATLEPAKAEQKLAHVTPAYDKDKLVWNRCPRCGSTKIGYAKGNGDPFQACFDCRVFLNTDGKQNPMKVKA